jgi:ParB/RepB/Spo0J family partition protein
MDATAKRKKPEADASAPPPPPTDPGRYEPAIALDLIEPSAHNRNATGDLDQLAASIREKGVINPITLRPHPHLAGHYELVAGERRWRAARLAGHTTIPAIVRLLSDVEVLEVQLVENVQRVDAHPLEEADGYRLLIDRHGYTVDRLAERTGKSKAWVYGRLKLCSLAQAPRAAFLDGRLQPSIALMIARIPSQELQEQATEGVLGLAPYQRYDQADLKVGDLVGDNGGDIQPQPLSTKQAAIYINRHYMLRLELARFDLADRTLVPAAGACTDCTHRTGNQRELFADVSSADVCTNPPCHASKTTAAFERTAAAAKAEGVPVLAGKKADGLFNGDQELTYQASQKYFVPDDQVPYEVMPNISKRPTWAKALGKELAEVPKVIAQDTTGAAREVYDRDEAIKRLKKAGKVPPKAETNPQADEDKKRRKALERRREVVDGGLRTLARAQASVFVEGTGTAAIGWWRWVAAGIARQLSSEDAVTVARAFGFPIANRGDAGKAIAKEIDAGGVLSCRGLIVAMLAAPAAAGGSWSTSYGLAFTDAAKFFGVDLKKLAELQADTKLGAKPKTTKARKASKAGS